MSHSVVSASTIAALVALVSAPPGAAQNYKVSDLPRAEGGGVTAFVLQAGEHVVYTTPRRFEVQPARVWSRPIDLGSPPALLFAESGAIELEDSRVTPDGAWTLFRTTLGGRLRLHVIPTDGSAAAVVAPRPAEPGATSNTLGTARIRNSALLT